MTSNTPTLTSTQLLAAHHAGQALDKVVVINIVALRGMALAQRAQVLALVDQAAIAGAKAILSLRSPNEAVEEMTRLTLPAMVTDEMARQRLHHNGKLLFTHDELAKGEEGIMGREIADIHLGLDIYQKDVPCHTFIDLGKEGAVQSLRAALLAPKPGPDGAPAPAPAA
jgi:hypothetical protein